MESAEGQKEILEATRAVLEDRLKVEAEAVTPPTCSMTSGWARSI